MSNKPEVSKAVPISKDIKTIVLWNLVVIVAVLMAGVLGLAVASAASTAL